MQCRENQARINTYSHKYQYTQSESNHGHIHTQHTLTVGVSKVTTKGPVMAAIVDVE